MIVRHHVSALRKLLGLLTHKPSIARAIFTGDLKATAVAMPSKNCLGSEWTSNEDYYRFTRGRFVYNEKHEMSQRYVRFNVHELARVAAEAVGSRSCIGIEKYPDGMYNKALLLTMEDGAQVVAKIPNPNAGRPHDTTASEVATMEFVCVTSNLQIAGNLLLGRN